MHWKTFDYSDFESRSRLLSCADYFCLPWSIGGWSRGWGKRTGLNEFPAKCPRSQGRAPRQRMAKQSMHPLASSIPTRGSHWKPRKLQVSSSFYCIMSIIVCNNSLYTGRCHPHLPHPTACSFQWLLDMDSKVWAKLLSAGACPLQLTCPAWRQKTRETTPTSTLSPKTEVAGLLELRQGTRGKSKLARGNLLHWLIILKFVQYRAGWYGYYTLNSTQQHNNLSREESMSPLDI